MPVRLAIKLLPMIDGAVDELQGRGFIIGVGDQIQPQLAALEQAGVQRIMLQWPDLDDQQGLSALAKVVL